MPTFIINPGTGPVPNASFEQAALNMIKFCEDVGDGVVFSPKSEQSDDGRYLFIVRHHDHEHQVEMPGVSLEDVRFMRYRDQTARIFPRLYVDGSSWLWIYAISMCRDCDLDEKEA